MGAARSGVAEERESSRLLGEPRHQRIDLIKRHRIASFAVRGDTPGAQADHGDASWSLARRRQQIQHYLTDRTGAVVVGEWLAREDRRERAGIDVLPAVQRRAMLKLVEWTAP